MVNPLRSYVAGAKSVLAQLMLEGESNGAADLVPHTIRLDTNEARDIVRAAPTKWTLKKSESHGGNNVILPGIASEAAWREAIEASVRETWIAQEYLQVPRMAVPVVEGGRVIRSEKYFNWNPFVFDGQHAGAIVRVSATPLITRTLGGGLLPTFKV